MTQIVSVFPGGVGILRVYAFPGFYGLGTFHPILLDNIWMNSCHNIPNIPVYEEPIVIVLHIRWIGRYCLSYTKEYFE